MRKNFRCMQFRIGIERNLMNKPIRILNMKKFVSANSEFFFRIASPKFIIDRDRKQNQQKKRGMNYFCFERLSLAKSRAINNGYIEKFSSPFPTMFSIRFPAH